MMIYIIIISFVILLAIIAGMFYERYKRKKEIQILTFEINRILSDESDEKVMLFTDEKYIAALMEQINRALESRQKAKTDYKKSQQNTKRMLSNVSHDIKTPLTVILGYLEMIRMDDRYDSPLLLKVDKKANQLMNLISEFFTLAKIEAGDIDLTKTRILVNEFCKEIIIDFYEILTEKQMQVDIQIPEEELYVYSNQASLKRILLNLITNAVRYGSEGNYLGLYIHYDANIVRIDVMDKGKGIEASQQEQIFERLYTLDDARNKDVAGNGLGLTIAKELTEMIGGKMILKSEPYIKTVFTLELNRMEY